MTRATSRPKSVAPRRRRNRESESSNETLTSAWFDPTITEQPVSAELLNRAREELRRWQANAVRQPLTALDVIAVDETTDEWAMNIDQNSEDTGNARTVIQGILDRDASLRDKYYEVAKIGYQNLFLTGQFYYDTQRRERYWFDSQSKILFNIKSDDFNAHVSIRFQISREDIVFKHLLSAIEDRTFKFAQRVQARRYCHFDQATKVLFFNHKPGRMLVLDGTSRIEQDNGNGCLFLWDEKWEIIEPTYGVEGQLRRNVTSKVCLDESEAQISLHEAEMLVETWILGRLFGSILPERPILGLIGGHGSGKTFFAELIGRTLYGTKFSVLGIENAKEDGALAYVCAKPLAVFDNADQRIQWLPDVLARCATGMEIPRRILYKTMDLGEYPVDVFLIITARQTPWARPDVVDRLLLFRTKRPTHFFDRQELFERISRNRAAIIGGLLNKANRAVKRLREGMIRGDSPYRLATFYKFALTTADHRDRSRLKKAFQKMIKAQEALYVEEEENLITLLFDWLGNLGDDVDTTFASDGRWTKALRISEVYGRLASRAESNGFRFTVKNPLSLGHELKQLRNTFRTSGILFKKDIDNKGVVWRFGLPRET